MEIKVFNDIERLSSALRDIAETVSDNRVPTVVRKYDLIKAMRQHFPEMLTGFNRRYMAAEIHGMSENGKALACGEQIEMGDGKGEIEPNITISCQACKESIRGMTYAL